MAVDVLRHLAVYSSVRSLFEIAKSVGFNSPLADETNRVADAALRDYTDQMARAMVNKPIALAFWDEPCCSAVGIDRFWGKAGILVPRNFADREVDVRIHKYVIGTQIALIKGNGRFFTPLFSLIVGIAAFVLLNPLGTAGAIVTAIVVKEISYYALTRFGNTQAEDQALKHIPRDVRFFARNLFLRMSQEGRNELPIMDRIVNRSFGERAALIETSLRQEGFPLGANR